MYRPDLCSRHLELYSMLCHRQNSIGIGSGQCERKGSADPRLLGLCDVCSVGVLGPQSPFEVAPNIQIYSKHFVETGSHPRSSKDVRVARDVLRGSGPCSTFWSSEIWLVALAESRTLGVRDACHRLPPCDGLSCQSGSNHFRYP